MGVFNSPKSTRSQVAFDSISSLLCGVYLEWRSDVSSFDFEPRRLSFPCPDDLQEIKSIPDYEVVFETGTIGYAEAKYDAIQLRSSEKKKLAALEAHFRREGIWHEVVYRKELEREGFIQTILLLRRYQNARYSPATRNRVLQAFRGYAEGNLAQWRERARAEAFPLAVVFRLLYEGELKLRYEPLQSSELQACLA